MGIERKRRRQVAAMVASIASIATVVVAAPVPAQAAAGWCGRADLPETHIQGDVPLVDQQSGRAKRGYNCGLALVGHVALDAGGRPGTGNANMAWAGHCAYVAGPGSLDGGQPSDVHTGVAVVDVSHPSAPRHVATLRTPGALGTLETLHAVEADDRSILAVGRYGAVTTRTSSPVDLYDVSDCARPKLLRSFTVPENVHNLTLSADGRRLYGTLPLTVTDISDPRKPRYVGNLEDAIPAQSLKASVSHEAWPSEDGRTLYVAGQNATDDGTLTNDGLLVLDISRWPAQPPVVLGTGKGPGHSIRSASVAGRRLLVHSDETPFPTAYGCVPTQASPWAGPSQTYLTDITDPSSPRTIGELRLAINDPLNCPAQVASRVNASVHYHDVDDPNETRFVAASMFNAGVRVFDVRDPLRPREIAYFNAGDVGGDSVVLDQAWGHVRYVARTGQLWFATASGGFWVVELEPQVRRALGLGARPVAHPNGRPGAVGLGLEVAGPALDGTGTYCSLAVTAGAIRARNRSSSAVVRAGSRSLDAA